MLTDALYSKYFPIPSEKTARYFGEVLRWLDAGAPHLRGVGFNMNYFAYAPRRQHQVDDFKGDSCGTVCCIAGSIYLTGGRDIFGDDICVSAHALGDAIGLTQQQTSELFYGEVLRDEFDTPIPEGGGGLPEGLTLDEITPKEAAHAIRTMLETGRPEWKK